MSITYEKLKADLKETESNVFQLMKKLDDANIAQSVTAEALERANGEKKLLREDTSSSQMEVANLTEAAVTNQEEITKLKSDIEVSEKARLDIEVMNAILLAKKKSLVKRLENIKAEFIANFHDTEAYFEFSNLFASRRCPMFFDLSILSWTLSLQR
ncbi:hypothetical protein Adt_05565 [Abeliophyllum distichum]|uniref:Uncharacterized protein n=1 Tax=Abeliophyllum distichum TaxID=126358 RepID=A0ABD1V4F8_9LAMI